MYRYEKSNTALGLTHEFKGPGLGQYCNDIHLIQMTNDWFNETELARTDEQKPRGDYEAEKIISMLKKAYEAGRQSAKKEIREVLGVYNNPR